MDEQSGAVMETQIIQRCKDGDLHAFEEVFHRYGGKLFGLCLRMCGNRSDAEDLLQEIFVLLLNKIRAFRGESRFSTWLYRVAVNACISHLRRQRTVQVPLDEQNAEFPARGGDAPDAAVHRAALVRAIGSLPEGYRAAVILHDIQGFSHDEIAEILGISAGASKSQLFKARRRMREMITGQAQGTVALRET